jgi:hypothetical protein
MHCRLQSTQYDGHPRCGVAALGLALLVSGCMSWDAGWSQIEDVERSGAVDDLIAAAREQLTRADSRQGVLDLIAAYEAVLEVDPQNYEALWSLGRYCNLMGYAYSGSRPEKGRYYLRAVTLCERAMYTNPDFRDLVDSGEDVWCACRALSKREMAAMWYWYTGVGTYWKECLNGVGQLANLHWASRLEKVTAKMLATDPTWGGGLPYFGRALYFIVLPGPLGGDVDRATELLRHAFAAGPNWLYTRWGRAKYLHVRTGDREAFLRDLAWLLAQDPLKADSPYPWNVYYQRDAQRMIAHVEDYF